MIKNNNITPEGDLQRMKYHENEFNKKNVSNMSHCEAVLKGTIPTIIKETKKKLSPKGK